MNDLKKVYITYYHTAGVAEKEVCVAKIAQNQEKNAINQ